MKKNIRKKITALIFTLTIATSFILPSFAETREEFTPSGIPMANLEAEIDAFMDQYIGSSTPGASIAVVKNGEIVLNKGYGYADIEQSVPVTEETVFEYGSVSKLFVWTSVMQLVEEGKIDLDEDIRTYLPETFNEQWNITYPITMRNIMNHSAGFGEYPFDLIEASASDHMPTLSEAILEAHPKQYFEPGTASVYSNYATAIAAYVVESISGELFSQYEKNHIFDVIGMEQTAGEIAWQDNPSIIGSKAKGYSLDGQGGFVDTGWSYVSLYPAGSVNGTSADLAQFAISLMPKEDETSVLFTEKNTLSTMLSPSYNKPMLGTAHGFFEYNSASAEGFGHGGNTASFSTQFAFVPEESFALVILTNASSELNVTMGLQDLLLGKAKVNEEDQSDLPESSTFAGSYVSMRRPEGTPFEFASYLTPTTVGAVEDNRITFSFSGYTGTYLQTSPYNFELESSDHPLFAVMLSKLHFQVDEKGKPTQILVGKGLDYSVAPSKHSPMKVTANLITLGLASIFFLIMPIVLLITFFRRRKKQISNKNSLFPARSFLSLSGTALVINNIFFMLTLVSNQFIRYQDILPLTVLNYIFTAISVVFMALGFFKWRKEAKRSEKVWFCITIVLLISLVCVLISWNMFAILS